MDLRVVRTRLCAPSAVGGATTKTRIVFRDILRDRDIKNCGSYSLTNHTNQPSHQKVTSRVHRLYDKPATVSEFSSSDRREGVRVDEGE